MAIQKNFTDQYGVNFPVSYWVADNINVSRSKKRASISVSGFQDSNNKFKRIIGQYIYNLNGPKFDQYFSPSLGPIDLYHQLYVIVTTEPIDGELVFAGATQVP